MSGKITLRSTWADYIATRSLKPRTLYDHWQKLERCVPDWLDMDMNELQKSEVVKRHRRLSVAPVQANCVMRIVRTLYNFAIATYEDENEDPLIKRNPVVRLSQQRVWNKEHARDRHIPLNKIKDWTNAVLMLSSPSMRDYMLTLLLTGLRKTEAANLEWQNIDLDNRFLFIPETKNGTSHKLPLSNLLSGMLQDRARERETEFVFPGVSSPYKTFDHVSEAIGIKHSPHDLRRTFLLVAEDIPIDEFVRKRLVNHTFEDVTGKHYSIKNPEKLRTPMQQITDRVLELAELN